jgi:hypothetical protein
VFHGSAAEGAMATIMGIATDPATGGYLAGGR